MHRVRPERLEAPGTEADATEGWIWLPATASAGHNPPHPARLTDPDRQGLFAVRTVRGKAPRVRDHITLLIQNNTVKKRCCSNR